MDKVYEKKELKKKSKNISDWYTDVVLKAELADYGPVRGTMVIRPYGFAIWERVQHVLGQMINDDGVENAYFPLFIPYSLLAKEKEHVEGFSPELALVTKGGGEDLKEPLVVRPTSETVMYGMYSKWIKSWRDLPLKINQWNNVVRWEKRTYLFLRTLEFLWQEGHCAHSTQKESLDMVLKALDWYRQVYEDYYAIPVIYGIKSESEKFAGAVSTYCIEALMPDGKALQGATSHDLGQNFSKAQDITFQDKSGKTEYVWQNSWGFATRTIGALVLVHGDNDGLILPPKIAPVQVVIIPIPKVTGSTENLIAYCNEVLNVLKTKGIMGKIDIREGITPGRKFNDWEIKGVPVRFEIGINEVEKRVVTVVRRDTREKYKIEMPHIVSETEKVLDSIQKDLFAKAKKFLDENTHEARDFERFKEIMKTSKGFIKSYWCEGRDCEMKIKDETKATTRCKSLGQKESNGNCIYCGQEAKYLWYFAQAY